MGCWAILCSGCAKYEPLATEPRQVLRVSQRNEPSDLDPATATLPDEFFIVRALSEGLLVPDPAGGPPLPGAAERSDSSADGLTYTFYLRNAKWSNGEPVTAGDFVDSFKRSLSPATASPKAHLFYPVKNARAYATGALADFSSVGFRALDPRTVVITLTQPTPRFLYYVASGPWIPINPRAVAQYDRTWTQPGHFVGNGPFVLTEWRPQQRIVVQKNPAYHDLTHVKLDEIQFLRFDNGDTEEHAFRAGQIDVTMDVPRTKIVPYQRDHPGEFHRAPLAETRYLSFNTKRPALSDPRVRRALALTLDRPRLVERVLLGGQLPANEFLPPALNQGPRAAGVDADPPPFAPAEAQRLLTEAGFSGGKNFPRFEMTAWSTSQTPVLETIQAMWRQHLGIDVAIAIRDAKVHLAALASGDYDIAFVTTLIDVADPVAALADLTTAAPNNFPHWSDEAYDSAVARADVTAAASRLLEAVPVVPVYYNTHNWLMSPRVHGWQDDAFWTRRYLDVSLHEN